ncbi:segregation/condensation protein A [Nannocystis pusilla]|uniref:Segregation and condensation protein A n=1 Tax=Nannocystis pusilla TaxID=889268 RepID=A0ABS7TXR9_9BACT|nr:segregation/condensation protein A [Nannocystis pusilla]
MEQGSTGLGEGAPRARERKGTSSPIYSVELEVFEGPLDLLLHLVRKHELDILDIPIAFVAEKYLEYLDVMRQLDLEIAGDYLVMAATLAYLKSRELLPPEPRAGEAGQSEEEEGEDPREALIRRLVEYERFKQAAAELDSLPVSGRDVFARGAELVMPPIDPGLAPVSLFNLAEAYYRVLTRAKVKSTHEVQIEAVTVAQRIKQLALILDEKPHFEFEELFLGRTWNSERELRAMLVVTLMSILEMVKLGVAGVQQPHDTPNIRIYRRASAEQTQAALADYDEDASFGAPTPKAEDAAAAAAGAAATPARTPSEADLDAVEEAALLAEALASVQEPEEPVLGYADESEDVAANDPAAAEYGEDAPARRATGRPSRERRRESSAVSEDMSGESGDVEDVSEDMWRESSLRASPGEDSLRGAAWAPERTGAADDEGGTAGTRSATDAGEVGEAEAVLADSTEASAPDVAGESDDGAASEAVGSDSGQAEGGEDATREARDGAEETRGDGEAREAVPEDSEDSASETAGWGRGEQAGAMVPADDQDAASETVREDNDASDRREDAAVRLMDESAASEAVREDSDAEACDEDADPVVLSDSEGDREAASTEDASVEVDGDFEGDTTDVSAASEALRGAASEDESAAGEAEDSEDEDAASEHAVTRWGSADERAASEALREDSADDAVNVAVRVDSEEHRIVDGLARTNLEDTGWSAREGTDVVGPREDATSAAVVLDGEDAASEAVGSSSESLSESEDAASEAFGSSSESDDLIGEVVRSDSDDVLGEAVGSGSEDAASEAVGSGSEDAASEAVGSGSDDVLGEAVRSDSEDATSEAVSSDSDDVLGEAVGSESEDAASAAVGSGREDATSEAVRSDSDDVLGEAVGSDSEDATSEAVRSNSDDVLGEALRSESEDAASEVVGSSSESEDAASEAVGSGSDDVLREAVGADSEDAVVTGEAVRVDGDEAARAEGSRDASEAVGSDSEEEAVGGLFLNTGEGLGERELGEVDDEDDAP